MAVDCPTPMARSTSPTPRSFSITSTRSRRWRSSGSWPASRGVGIVVNDLSRGRLSIWGAWTLAHVTTRNRFTRHDAPLSTRRAYTPVEAVTLLTRADLRPVFEARGMVGHRWVIAAVPRTTRGS